MFSEKLLAFSESSQYFLPNHLILLRMKVIFDCLGSENLMACDQRLT